MNDKELIEELREYATALRASVHVPHTGADLIERGADALAARQPTEDGELAKVEAELDERLAGKRSWCDEHHGKPDEIERTAKAYESTIRLLITKRDALRTVVPGAATEGDYHEGLEEGIKIGRAERDAALAAVERVRAAVNGPHPANSGLDSFTLAHISAELDGAPEPEWEYVGMAFEHGGFMRIRNDQLTPEKFESWRKLMTKYPRVEILKRVKAVPAGPWLPVKGESKP